MVLQLDVQDFVFKNPEHYYQFGRLMGVVYIFFCSTDLKPTKNTYANKKINHKTLFTIAGEFY